MVPAQNRLSKFLATKDIMDFLQSLSAFKQFLIRSQVFLDALSPVQNGGRPVVVMVSPWQFTPVPWYAICLALLYRSLGCEVRVIWCDLDDAPAPSLATNLKIQNQAIEDVLSSLTHILPVYRLSQAPPLPLDRADNAAIDLLSHSHALMHFRTSVPQPGSPALEAAYGTVFRKRLAHISGCVHGLRDAACVVVPGGIYGDSGLFLHAGRQFGVRTPTYDSGDNVLILDCRDIAAHKKDLIRIFQSYNFAGTPVEQRNKILSLSDDYLTTSMEGRDIFRTQAVALSTQNDSYDIDVLILMNEEHDAAVLGQHAYFRDTFDWINSTVEHLLAKTQARITIRQHPGSRLSGVHRPFAFFFTERFGDNPRVTFYSSDAEVNTYALISKSKLVLSEATTAGLEAVMMGRPVVIESNVYYSTLPIVTKASTREEYFSAIERHIVDAPKPTETQYELTSLCYYLSQVCNYVPSFFTPMPADFARWVSLDIGQVRDLPWVSEVLQCLRDDVPIALAVSEKHVGSLP